MLHEAAIKLRCPIVSAECFFSLLVPRLVSEPGVRPSFKDISSPFPYDSSDEFEVGGKDSEPVLLDQQVYVPWRIARAQGRQIAVVADAGMGKTLLLWHELLLQSQRSAPSRELRGPSTALYLVGSEITRTLPYAERLSPAGIAAYVTGSNGGSVFDYGECLAEAIAKGDCRLLIDDVDWADDASANLVAQVNAFSITYPDSRLLIALREPTNLAPSFTQLQLLPFTRRQVIEGIRRFSAGNAALYRQVRDIVLRDTQLLDILRTPLLLNLACQQASGAATDGRVRIRHAELMHELVERLIDAWEGKARLERGSGTALLNAAAALVSRGPVPYGEWKGREVPNDLIVRLQRDFEQAFSIPTRRNLMRDLTAAGIVLSRRSSELGLQCPFPLLEEYFFARAIAADETRRIEFLTERAGYPEWETVFALVAGLLDSHPSRTREYLQLLSDPTQDDLLRTRLGTAALCLGELTGPTCRTAKDVVDFIVSELIDHWLTGVDRKGADAIPHLTRAAQSLCRFNWSYQELPVRQWILQQVKQRYRRRRTVSHKAAPSVIVALLGGSVADETLLEFIVPVLEQQRTWLPRNNKLDQRMADYPDATHILDALGPVAFRSSLLQELASWVHDPEWNVRSVALGAIANLGCDDLPELKGELLRAIEDILNVPLQLSASGQFEQERFESVAKSAAQCFFVLRDEDAGPTVLEKTARTVLEQERPSHMRWVRSKAEEFMGPRAQTAPLPLIVTKCIEKLKSRSPQLRVRAVTLLGILGASNVTAAGMLQLERLLSDPHIEVREAVMHTLGSLGSRVLSNSSLLERILNLMGVSFEACHTISHHLLRVGRADLPQRQLDLIWNLVKDGLGGLAKKMGGGEHILYPRLMLLLFRFGGGNTERHGLRYLDALTLTVLRMTQHIRDSDASKRVETRLHNVPNMNNWSPEELQEAINWLSESTARKHAKLALYELTHTGLRLLLNTGDTWVVKRYGTVLQLPAGPAHILAQRQG